MIITFRVLGLPRPAGSKRSMVPLNKRTRQPYRNESGGIIVNTVDDNPRSKDWKLMVWASAHNHKPKQLIEGAVAVQFVFCFRRPKGHFGTGRNSGTLKATAPKYHIVKPDETKLSRGTEDAMTGVIWKDDAQVVHKNSAKRYDTWDGCIVTIQELQ